MTLALPYKPDDRIPGSRYVIIDAVASGGQAHVYRARNDFTNEIVVVKMLQLRLRRNAELFQRVRDEARILVELVHPHIVRVIDGGITEDDHELPYLVMQALRGHTLQVVLSVEGSIDPLNVCGLGAEISSALTHAHEHGVIHGDVKPDNIYVHIHNDGRTSAILLDFGIFLRLRHDDKRGVYAVMGTPAFSSPEQLAGERVGFKSDIFSLGLVLYQMLTGRAAAAGSKGEEAFLEAYRARSFPSPGKIAQVPAQLDELVMQMLEFHPGSRPKDCYTICAVLNELRRSFVEGTPDNIFTRTTVKKLGRLGVAPGLTNLPTKTSPQQRASDVLRDPSGLILPLRTRAPKVADERVAEVLSNENVAAPQPTVDVKSQPKVIFASPIVIVEAASPEVETPALHSGSQAGVREAFVPEHTSAVGSRRGSRDESGWEPPQTPRAASSEPSEPQTVARSRGVPRSFLVADTDPDPPGHPWFLTAEASTQPLGPSIPLAPNVPVRDLDVPKAARDEGSRRRGLQRVPRVGLVVVVASLSFAAIVGATIVRESRAINAAASPPAEGRMPAAPATSIVSVAPTSAAPPGGPLTALSAAGRASGPPSRAKAVVAVPDATGRRGDAPTKGPVLKTSAAPSSAPSAMRYSDLMYNFDPKDEVLPAVPSSKPKAPGLEDLKQNP